jgi:hypothetical protein
MSEELKPLSKEVTDDIRGILEGIRSGRYQHDQRVFHSLCGTAHCVAGWKQALDYAAKRKEEGKDVDIRGPLTECFLRGEMGVSALTYAKTKWGLTDWEQELLFAGYADFALQFGLLETLEAGYRLPFYQVDKLPPEEESLNCLYLRLLDREDDWSEDESGVPAEIWQTDDFCKKWLSDNLRNESEAICFLANAIQNYQYPTENPIMAELLAGRKEEAMEENVCQITETVRLERGK